MATREDRSAAVGGGSGRMLTAELLDQFRRRLAARGIDVLDSVGPGLAEVQMDALMEPTRLRLSTEARVWWGWHNDSVAGIAPTY